MSLYGAEISYALFYAETVFFTMKDAKSTVAFVQALNESLESGSLMCQLYNGELNKYIMNLTNHFCRKQLELGIPKVEYVK